MATGAATTFGNTSKPQRMIAVIPLLFGIQQAAEGIVWQTMTHETPGGLHQFGVLFFLTFANVIWPSWVPWSFYKIEKNEKRKRILKILGIIGCVVSLLASAVLLNVEVKAYSVGHSLGYTFLNVKRYWPSGLEILLYLTPTLLPFFVSTVPMIHRAGYLVFGSLLLAQIINQETTTSVWCFFAALISLYVALVVLYQNKGGRNEIHGHSSSG
jgi:hypothetical protein